MTDKQERVYLVATGETVDGRETYTRHDSLPPMCDFETLFSAPPAQPADIGNTISSKTPEPNEENPYVLWREIHRLRTEVQGPSGFATWQDAAVAERVRRVKAEQELRAAQPAPAQEPQPVSNTDELPQRLSDERIMHFWDIHAGMPTEKYPLNYKDVRAFARAIEAAIVPPGYVVVPVQSLRRWRDAFAEELAGYDIDPPIHHVKTSHDEINTVIAAAPKASHDPR